MAVIWKISYMAVSKIHSKVYAAFKTQLKNISVYFLTICLSLFIPPPSQESPTKDKLINAHTTKKNSLWNGLLSLFFTSKFILLILFLT